jgi:hypothetical protein
MPYVQLKLPAELEFKVTAELTDTQRMGIAVAVISDEDKEYLLDWVKNVRPDGLGPPRRLQPE